MAGKRFVNVALLREQITTTAEIFCRQEGIECVDIQVKYERPDPKRSPTLTILVVDRGEVDPTEGPCWGDN